MKYVAINAGMNIDNKVIPVTSKSDALTKVLNHLETYVTYNTDINDLVARIRTNPSSMSLPDAYNTIMISLLMQGVSIEYLDYGNNSIEDEFITDSKLLVIKDEHGNIQFITDSNEPDMLSLSEYFRNLCTSVQIFTNKEKIFDDRPFNDYLNYLVEMPDPIRFITTSPVFNKVLELNNYKLCYIAY